MQWRSLLPRVYEAFFGAYCGLLPSQRETIPKVLNGENVLLIAPTGSGKTEAVVAPIAERALDMFGQTYALYIAPTRALANDLQERLKERLAMCGLRLAIRHGERNTIPGRRIPSIILTTPESLEVMLSTQPEYVRERLREIRAVIVDEVHSFYGTRRGLQLYCLLERLKHYAKRPLQRIGLSATVADPQAVSQFLQGSDALVEIVSVSGKRKMEVFLSHLESPKFEQFADAIAKQLQEDVLAKHRKVLIFANTRSQCDWLAWQLGERLSVRVLLHYSSLHKDYREYVEQEFRRSRRAICISTSTLELGIDIGDVDAIVLWGAPHTVSSFLQRLGRGNRRSNISTVYGICPNWHPSGALADPEDDLLRFMALIYCSETDNLERKHLPEYYSVLLQQLGALCIQDHRVAPDAFLSRVQNPPAFAQPEQLRKILDSLSNEGVLEYDARHHAWLPTDRFHSMREKGFFWGNIGGSSTAVVVDESEQQSLPLAQIPREYAMGLTPGRIIVLAGRPRLIIRVQDQAVQVVELKHDTAELARYFSPPEPTPKTVAQAIRTILTASDSTIRSLPVQYDEWTKESLQRWRQHLGMRLKTNEIVSEWSGGRWFVYTFAGSVANWILSDLMSRQQNVTVDSDSWRISCSGEVNINHIYDTDLNSLRYLLEEKQGVYQRRLSLPPLFWKLPPELQKREMESLLQLDDVLELIQSLRQ